MIDNLTQFLEDKYKQYSHPSLIEDDPIIVPHQFEHKHEIEIAAFLAATLSWGQRATIIKKAIEIMQIIDFSPKIFIETSSDDEFDFMAENFKHRTFNGTDLAYFFKSLKNIYLQHGGLEKVFADGYKKDKTIFSAIAHFRSVFFSLPHPSRTEKHVANVLKGASAKRLNMFLRWMVRPAKNSVDFGIWKKIPCSKLMLPLDVHSGTVARKLGLLQRKQNDWKAVSEVTSNLRKIDKSDPVKYDYALFGLGVYEKF